MRLTTAEIQLILEALSAKYGMGYSDKPEVGRLQAKLSIMQQMSVAQKSGVGNG
jgi:hypothetical protein